MRSTPDDALDLSAERSRLGQVTTRHAPLLTQPPPSDPRIKYHHQDCRWPQLLLAPTANNYLVFCTVLSRAQKMVDSVRKFRPPAWHEGSAMTVLHSLRRLLLHHPLTKSYIEDALPGSARTTKLNTVRNRHSSEIYPPQLQKQQQSRRKSKKRIRFQDTCKVLLAGGSEKQVPVNFVGRNNRPTKFRKINPTMKMPDEFATPYLDIFSKKVKSTPRTTLLTSHDAA